MSPIIILPVQAIPLGAPTAWTTFAGQPLSTPYGASGTLGDGRPFVTRDDRTYTLDVGTLTWNTHASVGGDSGQYIRGVTGADGNFYTGFGINPITWNFRRFNTASNTWTELAPLPGGLQIGTRLFNYAISYGGNDDDIYTFGGQDGLEHNTIYRYDVSGNSWSNTGDVLPKNFRSHDAVRLNDGRIWVGGRYTGLSAGLDCIIYDPDGSGVTPVANFPNATNNSFLYASLLQTGNVYVAGPSQFAGSGTALTYEYDVGLDSWTARSALPVSAGYDLDGFVARLQDGRYIVTQPLPLNSYISTASL